jgi:ABC-type multidrug transport system fused ATPase/permease subunit
MSDAKVEVFDRPAAQSLDRARGEVRFENVSFDYPDRVGTLRGISFVAEPGAVVALVGPTGAGKSTLVSLLPRLVDPHEGRVLLDGVDLRDLKLADLRDQCSIVMQEPLLFSGTIGANIRYGELEATDEQVQAAARDANAHDFIPACRRATRPPRRTRPDALGRRAPAHRHRPRLLAQLASAGARRADVLGRLTHRGGDP